MDRGTVTEDLGLKWLIASQNPGNWQNPTNSLHSSSKGSRRPEEAQQTCICTDMGTTISPRTMALLLSQCIL
ncbi:Hypothetical predicted protein [Marmota monax]|uniref:Uncharacterized protein n=1 Tax=Marmota monax TaxID=9995 RepID=A0A5E4A3C3_MARMO|nr:Hypothetical predicted protein [Marmota monax]